MNATNAERKTADPPKWAAALAVLLLVATLILPAQSALSAQPSEAAAPENPAVDTDGAIDLAGSVVVPSRWAVLALVLFALLASALVALLAQRQEERREAAELRRRLAEQALEIERLRGASAHDGEPP